MASSKARGEREPETDPSGTLRIPSSRETKLEGIFTIVCRLVKRSSNKAAGESKPQAYPLGYVEDFDDPRTTLGTVFTSLLAEESHYGKTHQQIVDGVSQDTRQQTPGLFIDPSPEHSAPTDTQ